MDNNPALTSKQTRETNKVLSQTYQLLSITLFWSAFVAYVSMATNFTQTIASMGSTFLIVFLVAYFANLFLIEKNKNNNLGLLFTFTLTGLLGLTISPLLHFAFSTDNSGAVLLALLGTGIAFFSASAYGKATKKDLSGYSKLLFFGILGAFVIGLINAFFIQAGLLALIISGAFAILMPLLIAWQIQAIVNGGETNYISATVTLFVAVYNMFSSLLHIILSFND